MNKGKIILINVNMMRAYEKRYLKSLEPLGGAEPLTHWVSTWTYRLEEAMDLSAFTPKDLSTLSRDERAAVHRLCEDGILQPVTLNSDLIHEERTRIVADSIKRITSLFEK